MRFVVDFVPDFDEDFAGVALSSDSAAFAFVVLLIVAPPATSGWDFLVGAIVFALFSLPTWLVLFGTVWLLLVVKPWFLRPPVELSPAATSTTTSPRTTGTSRSPALLDAGHRIRSSS